MDPGLDPGREDARDPGLDRDRVFLDRTEAMPALNQVWSLTQFYSVDFSKSRIGVPDGVLVSL